MSTPALVAFGAEIEIQAEAPGAQAGPPRFSMTAYTGGAMRLGGWRHPVVVDLAGMRIPSQKRPIRMNHNPDLGVGHTESIAVENNALRAAGVVSRDTPAARDVVAGGRNGFPWQASIGASVEEHEFVREGDTATVNGREFKGPVNVVRRSTLGEISFVDLGADGDTTASIAAKAAQHQDKPMDLTALKALTDKHPTKAGQIVAMAAEGKPLADIESHVVEAARAEELAALKAACDGHEASLKAEREAHEKTKADLKAAQDQVAALKAHRQPTDVPGGTAATRRSQMDLTAKAKFIQEHGRSAYESLPE